MHIFTHDEEVVTVGATMLMITSWNFAANGIIFSCSSMFQGLGNTWPTISSSIIRVFVFIVPVLWLSTRCSRTSISCTCGIYRCAACSCRRRELRAAAPGVRIKLTKLAPIAQPA